jgi:hypothetical protein
MASPTTATLQTIRYEQPPVLQHVSAYGSETLVPNDDICRLSYYLKCCVVGCGIDIGIEDDLLDYMNAHQLSAEQQEKILQHALSDLNALSLLNRAFILDDKHTLLPRGTLNTFFEITIASEYFSINSFTIATGQQVYIHKVMLCTLKWMNEYYIEPFVRYHQGNPIIEIDGTSVQEEDELSVGIMLDGDYTQQGLVVTPVWDHRGEAHPKQLLRTCYGCTRTILLDQEPCYRCIDCKGTEYCQDCYNSGEHDQTHTFERVCRTSIESLKPRIQVSPGEDNAFLPDVPLALVVPVASPCLPATDVVEPVARAVGDALCAAASTTRLRRRGSDGSSSTSSSSSYSSRSHRRAKRIRKSQPLFKTTPVLSAEDERKPEGGKDHECHRSCPGPSSGHQSGLEDSFVR